MIHHYTQSTVVRIRAMQPKPPDSIAFARTRLRAKTFPL